MNSNFLLRVDVEYKNSTLFFLDNTKMGKSKSHILFFGKENPTLEQPKIPGQVMTLLAYMPFLKSQKGNFPVILFLSHSLFVI